jgi:hypothetical protein
VGKEVKQIDVVFENCEVVTFPKEYIGQFYLGELKEVISRRACNQIDKHLLADKLILEVRDRAALNTKTYSGNAFDRVKAYDDITHIDIIYEDGSNDYIGLDYDEGESEGILGANNINQKSRINKFGDLELLVGKDLQFEDYFIPIESQHYRDHRWKMFE